MAEVDDWDADDFEIPTLPAVTTAETKPLVLSQEEEDLALKEAEVVKAQPSAAVLAAQEKKAKEEEKALAAKAVLAQFENETPEERRLREKRQSEESEVALANEMLGTNDKPKAGANGADSLAQGLGNIALKTKDDHSKYGALTRTKLSNSSAFNIAAFYKSLSRVLDQPGVTAETLDEIIADLTTIRETKAKAAAKQNASTQKKSKKAIEKEIKKHADKFGEIDLPDEYIKADKYLDMEDDYF